MTIISIVMPLYNQANVVGEAIRSVINQTFQDWELIVVDDCSTDNSKDVVKTFIYNDSRIRLVELSSNTGSPIVPRNQGITVAEGEYILPLDADDVLYPDCLTLLYQAMSMNLGDVVYPKVEFIGEKTGIFECPVPTRREMRNRNCVVNTSLFKKCDWEKYGGYDINFSHGDEDWAFWLNFLNEGKDFYQVPEVLLKYRVSSSGRCISNLARAEKKVQRAYLRQKYEGLYAKDIYYTLSLKDRLRLFIYSLFHGGKKLEKRVASVAIPCLKKIDAPRIFMVLSVKNENDIIEKNIVFHKEMGVDGFIITDNGSEDGTRETLERLKKCGLVNEIIDEPSKDYRQKEFVHRMIMLAKRKYQADFVISADADEFWFPKGRSFKGVLRKFKGAVLHVPVFNMLDEGGVFLNNTKKISTPPSQKVVDKLIALGSLAKYHQFSRQIPKVVVRASEYSYIANGNHDAVVERPHRKILSNQISIYHFSSRGLTQFKKKNIDNGCELCLNNKDLRFGVHWRYFYEQFSRGVSAQDLYNKYTGKNCLSDLAGCWVEGKTISDVMFLRGIKDDFPQMLSFKEMLDRILAGSSLIRYGDAEFDIGFIQENKEDPYQRPSARLTQRLALILEKDDPRILVCIPPIESEHNNIRNFRRGHFDFWEWYWIHRWNRLSGYIKNKVYGNSFFSRDAVFYELDVSEIAKIWNGRRVVFVYSKEGRFIFEPRLFSGIKEMFEVFVPATNDFDDYDRILSECLKFPKDVLFFISAGPTACVLVDDLAKAGYQALDMGHFPNCYLQYLGESPAPESLPLDKTHPSK